MTKAESQEIADFLNTSKLSPLTVMRELTVHLVVHQSEPVVGEYYVACKDGSTLWLVVPVRDKQAKNLKHLSLI